MQKTVGNDRAILRALHYFEENARVEAAAQAVKENNGKKLLQILTFAEEFLSKEIIRPVIVQDQMIVIIKQNYSLTYILEYVCL